MARQKRWRIYDHFNEWWDSFPDSLPLVAEHMFAYPLRRWRFDFAHLDSNVAIELDGATWAGGRHSRGYGFQGDCEKLNHAAALGWFVFRLTPQMLDKNAEFWREMILGRMNGMTTIGRNPDAKDPGASDRPSGRSEKAGAVSGRLAPRNRRPAGLPDRAARAGCRYRGGCDE